MTFSEFTDCIIEFEVHDESGLWGLAKRLKVDKGEAILWNYLESRDPATMLAKVWSGWNHDKLPASILQSAAAYSLTAFNVPPLVAKWMQEEKDSKVMVLSGPGGCGKKELAFAILHQLTTRFYFIDKFESLKAATFSSGESLLVDDVTLAQVDVDECKSFWDVRKPQQIHCRHTNAFIPAGTIRIYSTNHSWRDFLPKEARVSISVGMHVHVRDMFRCLFLYSSFKFHKACHDDRKDAIHRRMTRVRVDQSLRRLAVEAPPAPEPDGLPLIGQEDDA